MIRPGLAALLLVLAPAPGFTHDEAADAAAPAAQSQAEPQEKAQAQAKGSSRNCVTDTGSRIKRKQGQCLPMAGTVLTREDLDRSGRADIGDALESQVPSLTSRP